jgi:fatty-acyl-CoA synthase
MMRGTMMDFPLTIGPILERAGKLFPTVELISRMENGELHRSNYGELYRRSNALAEALTRAGLKPGERVATLCWNHSKHLEAYFGIPLAHGVLHTLNLRLFPEDIAFIVNDAEDRFLIVDDSLLPLLDKFRGRVRFERVFVVNYAGRGHGDHESYEDLLATATGDWKPDSIEENDAAAMCYTSGTTGFPKGVVYSHRALVLHSLMVALPDTCGLKQSDCVMPVVPMFHANAWGWPYTSTMVGAKQVFPGCRLDAIHLLDLMEREQVTATAAVPTFWMSILTELDRDAVRWKLNPDLMIFCGGAAPPEALLRGFDRHGVNMRHSWGMTEMTPVGSAGFIKSNLKTLPEDELYAIRTRQGLPIPFVEARGMNEEGEIAWDGQAMGELQVRGPFVAGSYFKGRDSEKWTEDGWFRTGDVVQIDAEGYMKIVDRSKDVIKSGGEWISSVDLENHLMGHPSVQEAAVIGLPHPKWIERPLAAVVLRPNMKTSDAELREWLARKFAKWQIPDGFAFVDQIPRTATGKFLKTKLRKDLAEWKW